MAHEPHLAGMPPELVEASNAAKAQALRSALRTGLLGFGAGATLTGLLGLLHSRSQRIPSYPLQTEINLPYPQEVAKAASLSGLEALSAAATAPATAAIDAYISRKKAKDPKHGLLHGGLRGLMTGIAGGVGLAAGYYGGHKMVKRFPRLGLTLGSPTRQLLPTVAGPVLSGITGGAAYPLADMAADRLVGEPVQKRADWADSLVGTTMSAKPGDSMPPVYSPRWARGDTQTSWPSVPWGLPLASAAAVGGPILGHQIVKHILRKRRKAGLNRDLASAQKEYDEAMLSQYDPAKLRKLTMPKEAAATTTALDYCFEKLGDFNDLLGMGAGAYGVGALALGGATGLGTYRWLRGRSGEKLLRDALKRRAMMRSLQNPPDMYVRPVPVEYVQDNEATAK